jgi:hypothetical protein
MDFKGKWYYLTLYLPNISLRLTGYNAENDSQHIPVLGSHLSDADYRIRIHMVLHLSRCQPSLMSYLLNHRSQGSRFIYTAKGT